MGERLYKGPKLLYSLTSQGRRERDEEEEDED